LGKTVSVDFCYKHDPENSEDDYMRFWYKTGDVSIEFTDFCSDGSLLSGSDDVMDSIKIHRNGRTEEYSGEEHPIYNSRISRIIMQYRGLIIKMIMD